MNTSAVKVKRNTNIEIMRLLSMVMVLIHHIVGQGIGFQFYCMGGGKFVKLNNWSPILLTESFCIVGVNLFLLISGYYGIKLRMERIVKFLAIVLGFVLIHSACERFYNDEITLKRILRSVLFFFSENTAWFVKAYFILMLSTFVINPALERMKKRQMITLLVILLFVNVYLGFIKHWTINENGYTVSHMIMMYIIGYALKIFEVPMKLKGRSFLMGYIFLSALLGLGMCLGFGRISNEAEFWILSYNNPLIMLSAISLFCFFVRYEFHNVKLNYLLSGVFGIYLLHQYRPFWGQVMIPNIRESFMQYSIATFILYSICLVLVIIAVGIIVNLVLMRVINGILKKQVVSQFVKSIDVKLGL